MTKLIGYILKYIPKNNLILTNQKNTNPDKEKTGFSEH